MRVKLKRSRIDKGLSVPDMAGKLDISASFYYKIENGDRNPTMELAKRIADIFNSSLDDLFFACLLDDSSNKQTGTDDLI
jgi:putative transcriptional regulator